MLLRQSISRCECYLSKNAPCRSSMVPGSFMSRAMHRPVLSTRLGNKGMHGRACSTWAAPRTSTQPAGPGMQLVQPQASDPVSLAHGMEGSRSARHLQAAWVTEGRGNGPHPNTHSRHSAELAVGNPNVQIPRHAPGAEAPSGPSRPPFSQAKADAARLTRQIVACSTWQELAALYQQRSSSMDFIHLSAALTHLAKTDQQPAGGSLGQHGASPVADASGASTISKRAAKRNQQTQASDSGQDPGGLPDADGLDHLCYQLLHHLCSVSHQLRAREAANVAWAMARLKLHPTSPPVNQLLSVAWSRLRGMNSQELSNMLYAAAMMGAMPSQADMEEAIPNQIKAVIHTCEPQGLANIVWALGGFRQQQHPAMLRLLLQATYARLYDMTPEGLAGVTHGFAHLRVRLPGAWRDRLLDAAWRRLPPPLHSTDPTPDDPALETDGGSSQFFRAPVLAQLLYALVKAGCQPPRAWLAGCLTQIHAHSASLGTADMVNVLWALAQLRLKPPLPLLAALMDISYTHLKSTPVTGLASLAWSLAMLDVRPANAWVERFLRSVFSKADEMQPRQVASILWALTRWSLRPNAKFVHGLLDPLQETLVQRGTARDLYHLACALPTLRHPLPAWVGDALQQLAERHLSRMPVVQHRGQVVQGLQQLGLDVQGLDAGAREAWDENQKGQ